jgi:glutathione synthase/RimK-type ligase-like ATP-grasp enzyme
MIKIGILTCDKLADLTDDDKALIAEFSKQGALAKPLIWSQDEGEDFDLILVRSPWDYYLRQVEFGLWLAGRAQSGTRFLNDVRLIRWNIHKFYLQELAQAGLAVIDTVFARQGEAEEAIADATARSWARWIVKPAISANAHETRVLKVPLSDENLSWAFNLIARGDALIQPFVREIETRGELSIVAIGGNVSHVYLKKPRAGDFRVQPEFGGTFEQVPIEPWHRKWAEQYLTYAKLKSGSAEPIAYARVDLLPAALGAGLPQLGLPQWCLSELELFEPALHLNLAPGAAAELAQIALVHAQWDAADQV